MVNGAFRTALAAGVLVAVAAPAHAQGKVSFSKDVLPIFQRRCQSCHLADAKGGLKLDSFESLVKGGAKTPSLFIAGQPDRSRLIRLVEGLEQPRMPPGGPPLSTQDKATLRQWVLEGANDDSSGIPAVPGAAQKLQLLDPKDGSTVREKVRIRVPHSAIPPEGFMAVYIDTRFKAALAPPSPEEIDEKKLKPESPVEFVWDTKAPLTEAENVSEQDRIVGDGPHIIEVRTYKNGGALAETLRATVNVQNAITAATNQPVRLWYGGQVGRQYFLEHTVDLEANAGQAGVNAITGRRETVAAGPSNISHKEIGRYLVSLEDLTPAGGIGFWRERRESPLTITVNGLKQIVRFDTSSRYYSVDRRGRARRSQVMERENRHPIVNPIDLPGRPHRMNEPFATNLRINLGTYIPAAVDVTRLQATVQGLEWQNGEQCAVIKVDYFAGKSKVDILSSNIRNADFDIESGKSTIWFSQKSNRVLRATHEITGNLQVDVSQLGGGGAMGPGGGYPLNEGAPGGDYAPGMPGAPGMMGMPGGGNGPGGGAFGAPFSGAPYGGAPYGGMRPGMQFGGAGGNGPGGGLRPPGMMGGNGPGGYPGMGGIGMPGSYGPSSTGNTGLGGPATKRYHVNLKVSTQLIPDPITTRR